MPSYLGTFTDLLTFQVEDFALPAATALSSLWSTTPLLAAEHFWLLAAGMELSATSGYICTVAGNLPLLNSRCFCLLSHILTFDSFDIFASTHCR